MRYLFVVAHPDDESDAAGGTISKLIKEGNDVAVAIMVSQASARRNLSATLDDDEKEALSILGVKKVYHADYPNIKMNTVPHLESKNEILNSTSPTGSSVYFCTVDIYSFIHPWYGYLSF